MRVKRLHFLHGQQHTLALFVGCFYAQLERRESGGLEHVHAPKNSLSGSVSVEQHPESGAGEAAQVRQVMLAVTQREPSGFGNRLHRGNLCL